MFCPLNKYYIMVWKIFERRLPYQKGRHCSFSSRKRNCPACNIATFRPDSVHQDRLSRRSVEQGSRGRTQLVARGQMAEAVCGRRETARRVVQRSASHIQRRTGWQVIKSALTPKNATRRAFAARHVGLSTIQHWFELFSVKPHLRKMFKPDPFFVEKALVELPPGTCRGPVRRREDPSPRPHPADPRAWPCRGLHP